MQPPAACGPGVPTPCSTFAPQGIEAAAKTPAANEWNLTLEQQVGSNTAVRIGYVGSFGYHGLLSIDPNTIRQGLADLNQSSGQRKSTRKRLLGAPGEENPARPEDGDAHATMWTPRISPRSARSRLGPRGERTGPAHG